MSLPPLIDIEKLFADPLFSGASISPDGTRIAYLAPSEGRTNVWVRGVNEGHEHAVCVTHDSRRGIRTFRWTDDPRWLLYLQDTDGNEDWHLYRVDLNAPQAPAVDLTPMERGSRVMGFEKMRSRPGNVLVTMNRSTAFFRRIPDRGCQRRDDAAAGKCRSEGRLFLRPQRRGVLQVGGRRRYP